MADQSEIAAGLADEAKKIREAFEAGDPVPGEPNFTRSCDQRLVELARIVERLCEVVSMTTAEPER